MSTGSTISAERAARLRNLSKRSRARAGDLMQPEDGGTASVNAGGGTATEPATSKGSLLVQMMKENKDLREQLDLSRDEVTALRRQASDARAREANHKEKLESLRVRVAELEADLEAELEAQLENEEVIAAAQKDDGTDAEAMPEAFSSNKPSSTPAPSNPTKAGSSGSPRNTRSGKRRTPPVHPVATGPSASIPSPRSLTGQKTLFLAGSRRKLIHAGKDAPPAPTAGIPERPRFNNSANYHDPNDHEHDYSQSRSASRVVLLEAVHAKTAPKPLSQRKPVNTKDVVAIEVHETRSKISLYEAALKHSPMKVVSRSKRHGKSKMSHQGQAVLRQLPDDAKPDPLRFHRRHASVEGDRHSYHHHHHKIGADGFFQSVKNKKQGVVPKKLAHMAATVRGGASPDGKDNDSVAEEKGDVANKMIIEPHFRGAQARTAASGRGKSSPREMAFGRRRASVTGRDSHLTLHQNLGARDYMVGGGVRSAEPTYNRILPGAELDQEREAGRKKNTRRKVQATKKSGDDAEL